jgi:DNA-binding response OmpR family regulator
MKESILDGKKILIVDDEPDILEVLNVEIMEAGPNCSIDKANTYEKAINKLESTRYDVVILDIMGVQGFDLLEVAIKKNMKTVMLTAHALSTETLKRSHEMGARAYLPKEKLAEIVPFLEDVLKYEFESGWKRLFEKLHGFFTEKFETDWERKTGMNWKEW